MKELTLEITNKCYSNCKWCSVSATENGEHMPLKDCLVALRKHRKQCGVARISGGEPTLHPDLGSILSEARNLGYRVVLMTNGQYDIIRDSGQIDEIIVSVLNFSSIQAANMYLSDSHKVSLHVVNAKGNEQRVHDAILFSIRTNTPVHILKLQKQGRGINCEDSKLVSWTGENRCAKDDKITVSWEGKEFSCSALRNGKNVCEVNCFGE